MRVFVAVDIENELKEKIAKAQEHLKSVGADVKLVEPGNLHFTLKFLGDVPDEKIPEVETTIQEAIKGTGPFRISLRGMGYFGSRGHIKVVWVDVKEGQEKMLELMKKVQEALNYVRKDEFSPKTHLTLGRVRSGRNVEELIRKIGELKDLEIGEMEIKEIKLKSSVLTPEGPVYSDVKVFPLEVE